MHGTERTRRLKVEAEEKRAKELVERREAANAAAAATATVVAARHLATTRAIDAAVAYHIANPPS